MLLIGLGLGLLAASFIGFKLLHKSRWYYLYKLYIYF
jgi:hypothetical protein